MKRIKFNIGKEIKPIKKGKNCFLCKPELNKEPVIYQDKNFIAILDKYPPTEGYTILGTKKHIEDVTELSLKEHIEFQSVLYNIAKAIKKAFKPKRIVLVQTGGLISHFHFHIIPFYRSVGQDFIDVFTKKEILKFTEKEKEKIANQIVKYLKK
nr:HIT family protein [Candidatus Woesearchaeota archaeon]